MTGNILNKLCTRHSALIAVKDQIGKASEKIIESYSAGGKLLVCGNGGSCSDAEHFVGELMKSFELQRPLQKDIADRLAGTSGERGILLAEKLQGGLPAISLTSQTSLTTAISNDMDSGLVYAQQVIGYGQRNDVLIAISTSGNSENIINACITARAMYMHVIGLTGRSGGKLRELCDILINVPEERTALVQELHLPVLHALASVTENYFFGK